MGTTRKVKCRATGVFGYKSDFYKAPNGRYYQSEAIYQEWLSERDKKKTQSKTVSDKPGRTNESYKKLCDSIADLIGYDGLQPMPGIVFRKLKELDYYSDEIIQQTFDEYSNTIKSAVANKEFESDVNKVCYVMAIIRNNIAGIYRREQRKQNELQRKPSKPSVDEMIDLSHAEVACRGKDVSNLLGDDLWS